MLALVYDEGFLLPRDLAAAKDWMLKSAEQGFVPAQAVTGQMYAGPVGDGGESEYRGTDRWLRLAATQGDADAQFWLGIGYERGWFGGVDSEEARKWIRRAATQGLPDAQFRLGQMYEDGEGVPESNAMAASWFRKAADHSYRPDIGGVWEAEAELVYLYRSSLLHQDYVEAYMWAAIVSAFSVPPTDDDMKLFARHMTKAQIEKAQHKAEDWIQSHTDRREKLAGSQR